MQTTSGPMVWLQRLAIAAALIGLGAGSAGGEPFTRSTDKEVQRLIETIGDGTKRFEKSLDSKLKRSVLRGPNGEVDVDKYLGDFEASIKNLRKRFNSKYSASAELQDVISRAGAIHNYVRQNPALKGASEWDLLAADLNALATAYGAGFPPAQDAAFRRIGDQELTDSISQLGKESESVAKALKKAAKSNDALKGHSATGEADLKTFAANLKTLKSRLAGGKPATAEARLALSQADKIDGWMKDGAIPSSVSSLWSAASVNVAKVAQGFGIDRTAQVATQ